MDVVVAVVANAWVFFFVHSVAHLQHNVHVWISAQAHRWLCSNHGPYLPLTFILPPEFPLLLMPRAVATDEANGILLWGLFWIKWVGESRVQS